jgi:hypothetical protein
VRAARCSARPSRHLTDEDAALGRLGVRTIVDLRGVSEAAETRTASTAWNAASSAPISSPAWRQDPRRRCRRSANLI